MQHRKCRRVACHPLFINFLVGSAVCLFWAMPARSDESFVVSDAGISKTSIVISADAGERCRSLVEELRQLLEKITGASLPVVPGGNGASGLVVGTANDFPRDAQATNLAELGPEGFILRSENRRLLILGNTELALQHAIYTFLESQGCRWYFADPIWTVIPKRPSLSVQLNRRERPAYIFRRIWYGFGARTPKLKADYEAWMRHNRQHWLNSPFDPPFQIDTSHSYERHLSKKHFAEHPEWFALVGKVRKPRKLCISNPTVQKLFVQDVVETFRKNPHLNMVSVDPDDGGDYCECEECRKIGSVSDCVFFLANISADAVRKEFPDKWVGLNAYSQHSEPPRDKIHPGVYVAVTTRYRDTELTFEEQVKRFGDLGAKVGVYEYFSLLAWDWDMPGAALGGRAQMLGQLLRRFHDKLNVDTLDAESSCNWGPNGLGYWIAAHVMWNPELDPQELAQDFYQNAFGKASVPMKRLYDRWNSGNWFVIRQGVKAALDDLEEAYKLEKDPGVKARLDQVAMYLHWLRLNDDYIESVIVSTNSNSPKPSELVRSAHEMIVYSRRIMDTGLIHTFPLLFEKSWFRNRFATLATVAKLDFKDVEAWMTQRTDVPEAAEVAKNFADDVARYRDVVAIEPEVRTWSNDLVSVQQVKPEAVKEWGAVSPSVLPTKSGEYLFLAKGGEKVRVDYSPIDSSSPVQAHWKLTRIGESDVLAQGDIASKNGEGATCVVDIPSDGVFVLHPGQYSQAKGLGAEVSLGARPHAAFGGRYWDFDPQHLIHDEFILWRPELSQPLYFYVPKGTRRFVIGLDANRMFTKVVVKTPDGKTMFENDKVMQSIPSYKLRGQRVEVKVPAGQDDKIWSLGLESYFCTVELYGVPPYLSRHPSKLLVPREEENTK